MDIRCLNLIPIESEHSMKPTSSSAGSVHWPNDGLADIPMDLGLRLVSRSIIRNKDRRVLMQELGVIPCSLDIVKSAILKRYNQYGAVNLDQSVAHLTYLFRHDRRAAERLHALIAPFNQECKLVYRVRATFGREDMIVDDLYFNSPGVYNAHKLYQEMRNADTQRASGSTLNILHSEYMSAVSESDKADWYKWLERSAGILTAPRLLDSKGDICVVFKDILQYLPMRTVSMLKAHWSVYSLKLACLSLFSLKFLPLYNLWLNLLAHVPDLCSLLRSIMKAFGKNTDSAMQTGLYTNKLSPRIKA